MRATHMILSFCKEKIQTQEATQGKHHMETEAGTRVSFKSWNSKMEGHWRSEQQERQAEAGPAPPSQCRGASLFGSPSQASDLKI